MLFFPSSYRELFNSAIRDLNEESSSEESESYSEDSMLVHVHLHEIHTCLINNYYLVILHKDFDMGSFRLLVPL